MPETIEAGGNSPAENYANLFNRVPTLLPLLAAWIMRAWHFGADVDPGLLEWARVNEDGSTQLNHLTLEAVKGGGR